MSFMHYHTDLESVQDLTRDTVISIVSDALKVPATRVTCTSRLREDLGLDSLELAILTVKLEAEFGVDVFAEGIVATAGEVEARISGN